MLSELNITRFLTVLFIVIVTGLMGYKEDQKGEWGAGWMAAIVKLICLPIFIGLCCIFYKLTFGVVPAEPLRYLLITVVKLVGITLAVPVVLFTSVFQIDKFKRKRKANK